MPHDYAFRRITRADYPILHRWLSQPHVRETWGDPDRELALIEEEIDGGDCRMHIVTIDSHDAAFIQDWCPHLAGVPHFTDAPQGTRAIDTMLGEPRFLARGHAKAYARRYAQRLLDGGAARVVTDPRLTNPRGIAMYHAAGFVPGPIRIAEDGEEVRCMTFTPS